MHSFSWYYTPGSIVILVVTLIFSLAGLASEQFKQQCMLYPYGISRNEKLYTIFTSGLVHADIGHLAFNMLTFYYFAFQLEKYFLHTERFVLLYVAGLIFCDIPTIIKQKNNTGYYSLGASGAISAVLFCMILYAPTMGVAFLFVPFPIPGYVFGILYLIYSSYASSRNMGNINHDAHLYGALTGITAGILLNPEEAGHFIEKILHRNNY